MGIAQEREPQGRQAWWPLETMAWSRCFLFEWNPQLRYFGLGVVGVGAADDPDAHTCEDELELFFNCMESPTYKVSTAVTSLPMAHDVKVMAEDQLHELLQNFWPASGEEHLAGFNTSCLRKELSTTLSILDVDHLALRLAGPALPQPQPEQPPSPSFSWIHYILDPEASDTDEAQRQTSCTNCSSKRSTTPEDECTSKRSRTASSSAGPSVVYPFTVLKPCGVDGIVTLADINERILARPARPVRHPVGEFACAPRVPVSNRPAPSGKPVAGFTRLHTAGRGTITIIRTTG